MSVVPISGQPGLFRDERRSLELADYLDGNFGPLAPARPRWHALRGLGDARQDTIRSKLADVTASYNQTRANATKLLAAFGPLDETSLLSLGQAIKTLKARDAGAIARMTGAQFAGIVRMALASAKGNILRAEAITNGNLDGHEPIAERLLAAADNVLNAVGAIVNSATAAVGSASGYAQSVGLGLVIADDAVMAIVIAAGVLIGVGLLLGVYVYVHQSQAASDAADLACERDAAAGQPCTGGQWVTYRERAVAQERDLSPLPNMNPLFANAGSLLFWGGMAAAIAAIAYVGWTAAPAAAITRERLRAGAARL